METGIVKSYEDFFSSLESIPYFNPQTTLKNRSIVCVQFGGTTVDIMLKSQILIVSGVHSEIALSIGKRLKAPFCYWNREDNEAVLAFGKAPTNFVDKAKMLLMTFAIVPYALTSDAFNDKKVIIYKHYDDTEVSLYITDDISIYVNETKNVAPKIIELKGVDMEKFKDPESAEKELDEVTEASLKNEDNKPKAVYGDAVDEEGNVG